MEKYHLLLFEFSLIFFLISSSIAEQKNNKTIKYLKFPFKRNLTLNNSITPKQFFLTTIYNQIYIELIVGSKKQKIPFYLYLQQYYLVLQSSNAQEEQVKGIYDESKSNTYKAIEGETNFEHEDLVTGILSTDNFYFDSKPFNIPFFLSVENYPYSHITEGGKIGFRFWDRDEQPLKYQNLTFIKSLKNLGLISGYDFSFIYDSNNLNEDSGYLYLGAPLHDIDKNKYNISFFNNTYSDLNLNGQWGYTIEKTNLGNNTFERAKSAYFYPEFGFIVGTRNFFEQLKNMTSWNEYFNKTNKCHSCTFRIDDMDANGYLRFIYENTGYYCDKDVDVNKIFNESLIFYSKGFGNIFSLKNEDIWLERDGYKYLMILETLNPENCWIFGKPFFKKYHMTFNQDSKTIGVYTYINYNKSDDSDNTNVPTNKNKKTVLLVCIIIGLIIIIGVLVALLIKFYFLAPRKKKANELVDDNFEYKPNEDVDNNIMPSESVNKE